MSDSTREVIDVIDRRPRAWVGILLVAATFVASFLAWPYGPLVVAAGISVLVIGFTPILPLVTVLLLARALFDSTGSSASADSFAGITALAAGGLLFVGVGVLIQRQRALGLLLAAGAGSALTATYAPATLTDEAVKEFFRLASVFALAGIALNVPGGLSVRKAVRIGQFVGLVPAVLAIFQFVTGTGMLIQGDVRAAGTFAHPNAAALLFSLALLGSLVIYLDGGRQRRDLAAFALFSLALAATFSIGGMATAVVMALTYASFRPGASLGRLGGAVLVSALGLLAVSATDVGASRLQEFEATDFAGGESANSLEWRVKSWGRLLEQWDEAPWFGHGLAWTQDDNSLIGTIPHNEYVRALLELGVIGCGALLALLIFLTRRAARLNVPRRSTAGALAWAVIIGLLANSLGANTFLYSNGIYLAVLLFAACFSRKTPLTERPLANETGDGRGMLSRTMESTPAFADTEPFPVAGGWQVREPPRAAR